MPAAGRLRRCARQLVAQLTIAHTSMMAT